MGGFTVGRGSAAAHAPDYTGDAYLDYGSQCDGKTGADCFLSDAARLRIIGDFRAMVTNANGNYKQAVLELKIETLIEKEEEMPWYVSIALDLATMYIAGTLAKSLNAARAAGARKLGEMGLHNQQSIGYNASGWSASAERTLSHMTAEHLKEITKSAFEPLKKNVAEKAVKSRFNEAPATAKAGTISFLDRLRDSCDIGFRAFALSTAGSSNDAELLALWHGMQPELHTVGAYKADLSAKLDRFKKSGANDVGQRQIHTSGGLIDRIKRVVFVRDINGTTTPWFQNAEHGVLVGGVSGGALPVDASRNLSLEKPVPEEFRDIAIKRSESMFGPTPILDDGFVSQLKQTGQDPKTVRQSMYLSAPKKHKPTSVTEAVMDAFAYYADPHPLAPPPSAQTALPSGSVFADPAPDPSLDAHAIFGVKP